MCLGHCPDDEGLRAVHSGRLHPDRFAEIQNHLESCPACSARLDSLWNETGANPAKALPEPCPTPVWVEEWLARGAPSVAPRLKPPIRPGDIGRLGKYRLISVLGEGTSSVVYHGLDMTLERHVTLKVFRPGYGHGHARKSSVKTEAKAIASIDSDLVVRIIDIGRDGPTRFLVHPFTDGQTLQTFLASAGGSLDRAESLRLAREITLGLCRVHDSGLSHGDLKPANILVHRDREGMLHPRLIDLGLAGRKATGAGTRGYIAPEVERGGVPTPAADAYALGRVLEELRSASRKPWPAGLARAVDLLTHREPARRPSPRDLACLFEEPWLPRLGLAATALLAVLGLLAAAAVYLAWNRAAALIKQ